MTEDANSPMTPIGIPPEARAERPDTRTLHIGPPDGVSDEDCGTVESLVGRFGPLSGFADYWRPDSEQLAVLNAGGFIELVQYSTRMVMHSLSVWAVEPAREPEPHWTARAGEIHVLPPDQLTFDELQAKSVSRCGRWHTADTDPWSGADWSNAMCGEAGEAANVVKKLRRIETRTGDASKATREDLVAMLASELGDVVAYAVLVADHYGIDLGVATAAKFNYVSEREGFPERLTVPQATA